MKKSQLRFSIVLALLALTPMGAHSAAAQRTRPSGREAAAALPDAAGQSVVAPGVYMFQTRLDLNSCGDRIESGRVRTYVATVDGVPGSQELTMHLLNSDYWSTWTLHVTAEGYVVGDSQQDHVEGAARGDSHFELRPDGEKFTGRGSRSYMMRRAGESRRCRVSYDGLLRPLSV